MFANPDSFKEVKEVILDSILTISACSSLQFHERGFDLSAVNFRPVNQRQQFIDCLKMDFHWSWQSLVASALEVQVVSILNIKIAVPNFLFIRILLYKNTRLYKFCEISKNTLLFSL